MFLLLNFSLPPFFISLRDEESLYKTDSWDSPRAGPAQIWDFLKDHSNDLSRLQWVGGITGPGSFSSLRVNALILEILSQKYKIPIRSCRADGVVKAYLELKKIKIPFCLNAFGDNIFLSEGIEKDLKLIALKDCKEKIPRKIFTGFLPEEKQKNIPEGINEPLEEDLLQEALFQVLRSSLDQKSFIPYYGHAGV